MCGVRFCVFNPALLCVPAPTLRPSPCLPPPIQRNRGGTEMNLTCLIVQHAALRHPNWIPRV